ncbi:MAG: hypothetical protein ACI35U_06735 [Marinilabiliaceae bacterium]
MTKKEQHILDIYALAEKVYNIKDREQISGVGVYFYLREEIMANYPQFDSMSPKEQKAIMTSKLLDLEKEGVEIAEQTVVCIRFKNSEL